MPASDRFPSIFDNIPLKGRDPTKTKDKKTLAERLSAIVGFTYKDAAGTTYSVGRHQSGVVSIKRTAKDGAVSVLLFGSPDFNRTALMLLNAQKSRAVFTGKPKGMFKPSSQSGSSSSSGGDQSGQTGDQSGQAGEQTGTLTTVWANQPYLAEMLALVGFTGPDYQNIGQTLTVKKVTLDGY